MAGPKTRQVPLSKILIDQGTQCRATFDSATAKDFKHDLEAGVRMEEVVLFETAKGELIMGDGFTRLAGTKMAGGATIEARIFKGERFDALAYNARANSSQKSQRWTTADRKNAAKLILADSEGMGWSDRRIGDHCGLSDKTVADIRREQEAETGQPGPEKRKGKDGRKTPAKKPRKSKVEMNGDAHEEAPGEPVPQQGRPTVDWKEFDRAMGVLIRFPDEIGRHYPDQKDGVQDQAARKCLDSLAKIMSGWRRELKEIEKAEARG